METVVNVNVQSHCDGAPYGEAVCVATDESVDFGLLDFFLRRYCDRRHLILSVRRHCTATHSEATITVYTEHPATNDPLVDSIQSMLDSSRPATAPHTELMQQSVA